ncbi:tetratricopeptide repeat protein [Streptomyces albus subsp. chlorinus]|uniref:tetratricopeptide repeat protein n=1 Tax=Streptomyces albus TaxID=1888 RepID=UPI00156F2790|nr:tetratricopeptide repeat protein [Streptomyces albus]NSC21091.1 tetratricopeptide repeat protein [Streptomyces albus subsp. chlorinus]
MSELGGGGGDADAVALYERAVDSFLFFRGDVAETVGEMRRVAPGAPMGQVFAAYLGLLGTEEAQAVAVREEFARFRADADQSGFTERERAHLCAASVWLAGDIERAGALLREITVAWPRDTLALAVGHQIDFFTGNAASLRDRVAGALTAWSEEDPHYGPLLGMLGFGLEESGDYARAEETARAAVERGPRDVWGIHAVAHCMEMRGRFAEGIGYLDARRADWGAGNMMAVHNWWHYALYALEAGEVGRALDIYDAALHTPSSEGAVLELLDAASLLWRLYLEGGEVQAAIGGRWEPLADAWAARADGPHYSFNDVHAVMAYLGAGRMQAAEELVADRAAWAARPHPGVTNHTMMVEIGLPVCRALIAFGQGRYERAMELLLPLRGRLQTFGGSHAQRDVVQRTLVEAALRARRWEVARMLLSERLSLRPTSPYNWLGQARLADRLGQAAVAATARAKAASLAATGRSALAG